GDGRSLVAPQPPAGSPFAVLQPWSFTAENGPAESRPFLMDLPAEGQSFALDTDATYEPSADKPSEPHDFRISDNLKVKAQPVGGGLGGRVALTFSFPTGYWPPSRIAPREGLRVGAVANIDQRIVGLLDAVGELARQEQQRLLRFDAVRHRLVDGQHAEV